MPLIRPGTQIATRAVATRAVDQFIRRLRKIFEPDPAHPRYFLTVRDAGYRFVIDETPASASPE